MYLSKTQNYTCRTIAIGTIFAIALQKLTSEIQIYLKTVKKHAFFFLQLASVSACFVSSLIKRVAVVSDCSGTWTHNHLVPKQILNHFAKLAKWLRCVVSTYLYGCMFLSCHLHVSGWIHTLKLPEFQGIPCSKLAQNLWHISLIIWHKE